MADPVAYTDTHATDIRGTWLVLGDPPVSPIAGDMYVDSDQKALFRYTGNTWLGFKLTAA